MYLLLQQNPHIRSIRQAHWSLTVAFRIEAHLRYGPVRVPDPFLRYNCKQLDTTRILTAEISYHINMHHKLEKKGKNTNEISSRIWAGI